MLFRSADPIADKAEAESMYGIEFVDFSSIVDMDAVVLAVGHTEFSNISRSQFDSFYGKGNKILLDLKGLLNRKDYEKAGYSYWRL